MASPKREQIATRAKGVGDKHVLSGAPLYPRVAYTIFLNARPKVPHLLPTQNRKCDIFDPALRKNHYVWLMRFCVTPIFYFLKYSLLRFFQ